MSAVKAATLSVKGPFGFTAGMGKAISTLRQKAATPTRIIDARNGSIPDAMTGFAMIDPTACPVAAPNPNATPTQSGPLTASHA